MLLRLQAIDLDGDEIREQQDAIEDRQEQVERVLSALKADLAEQQAQLDATIQLQTEKQAELDDSEQRQKDSKARLTKVASTKEYSAVEQEIENIKRIAAQLEEELVQLLDAIEATRSSIDEKTAKMKALQEEVDQESDRATSEASSLQKKLNKASKNRAGVASDISKTILKRYEFIRTRYGKSVVKAENGACTGCFMHLPPQMFIEVQRATKMLMCPSCSRILYFEPALEEG